MKKLIVVYIMANLLIACSSKLIPNSKADDSLIGEINKAITSNRIGNQPLILLNEEKITLEELEILNDFDITDFTNIEFLSKSESKEKFGKAGKYGGVLITPFMDESLGLKYYEGIKNEVLIDKINMYAKQGIIKRNPILVLDGIPLTGENIQSTINSLGSGGIKEIKLLKKKIAYQIYGIRAINGVFLIESK